MRQRQGTVEVPYDDVDIHDGIANPLQTEGRTTSSVSFSEPAPSSSPLSPEPGGAKQQHFMSTTGTTRIANKGASGGPGGVAPKEGPISFRQKQARSAAYAATNGLFARGYNMWLDTLPFKVRRLRLCRCCVALTIQLISMVVFVLLVHQGVQSRSNAK